MGSVYAGLRYYVCHNSQVYPIFIALRMRLSVSLVNMSVLSQTRLVLNLIKLYDFLKKLPSLVVNIITDHITPTMGVGEMKKP